MSAREPDALLDLALDALPIRCQPRVRCALPASAESAGQHLRGQCRDLSEGGMLFLGPLIPVGETVGVALGLPDGEARLWGTVRYRHPADEGHACGILFLEGDGVEKVRAFVAGALGVAPAAPPGSQGSAG